MRYCSRGPGPSLRDGSHAHFLAPTRESSSRRKKPNTPHMVAPDHQPGVGRQLFAEKSSDNQAAGVRLVVGAGAHAPGEEIANAGVARPPRLAAAPFAASATPEGEGTLSPGSPRAPFSSGKKCGGGRSPWLKVYCLWRTPVVGVVQKAALPALTVLVAGFSPELEPQLLADAVVEAQSEQLTSKVRRGRTLPSHNIGTGPRRN